MSYVLASGIQPGMFQWLNLYLGMCIVLHFSVGLRRSWDINMDYTLGSGRWKWMLSGLTILLFLIQHFMDFMFAVEIGHPVKFYNLAVNPHLVAVKPQPPFIYFCADLDDPSAKIVNTR